MKDKRMFKPVAALAAAGLMATAPLAAADQDAGLGLRAGAYLDEGDPLLGLAYQLPVTSRFSVIPNAEYVFVDRGDLYTINVDGRYDLNPSSQNPMWVGAGVGMIHRDIGFEDDTDPALNLLWGMDFSTNESWTPFINTKAIVSDNSEFAFTFGVRFGQIGGGTTTAQNTATSGASVASTQPAN